MEGSNDVKIMAGAIKEVCTGCWSNSQLCSKGDGSEGTSFWESSCEVCGTVSEELTRRIGRELKERTWLLLKHNKIVGRMNKEMFLAEGQDGKVQRGQNQKTVLCLGRKFKTRLRVTWWSCVFEVSIAKV